jgi:hypothetical protein
MTRVSVEEDGYALVSDGSQEIAIPLSEVDKLIEQLESLRSENSQCGK